MRISWSATIGSCAMSLLVANFAYAEQKQLGTLGGTSKYSGVLQSTDKVNKNAQIIGGWIHGALTGDLGSLYQDVYTFTAMASGTATIENFWTDHPKGNGSLNCQFYSNTHDVQHDYIVNAGSTSFKVEKGREYSFVISSVVCDNQRYSFSLVLPGTTSGGGGGGGGGGGTVVTPSYVNVTFYANGGTLYEEDHFGASGYTESTISSPCTRSILKGKTLLPYAPSCKKNGYKFAGWFTAGGDKIQDSYTVKSTLSVYAQWHKKIEVKFDANGGYGSLGPQTFYSSEPAALLRNSGRIKNTGYTFKGWKEKNGSVIYADGATFSPTGDTTLYAVWESSSITVSFDEGGYVGVGSVARYAAGERYGSLPSPEPREGYDFVGWFTQDGEHVTEDSIVPKYNITLSARWELAESSITVKLKMNDGTSQVFDELSYQLVRSRPTYYGNLPTPSRSGFVFEGWYTSASGGERIHASSVVREDRTVLYAHWSYQSSYAGVSRFNVPDDEPDWCLSKSEFPMIVSGVFTSSSYYIRNEHYTDQSLRTTLFEPPASGYYTVFFNSEVDYSDTRERRTLTIEFSDGRNSLGELESSGTMGVYLQAGEMYCIYFKVTGDCADRGGTSSRFNIQIGGAEALVPYIDKPAAPVAVKEGDGVRVTWNAVQGATDYYVYRRRQHVSSPGKTGVTYPADYVFAGIVNSTTFFDDSLPHGFATDYYVLAGKEGAISGASGHSGFVTATPHFSVQANEITYPWNAREGYVKVCSDAYWTSSEEWLGAEDDEARWSLDFGYLNSVKGDLFVPICFDSDNTSGSDRVWRIKFNVTGIANPDSIVIRQKARGGDVQMNFMEKAGSSSRTYSEGEAYDDLPAPERAGYTFLGWTFAENGGEFVTGDMLASADTTELYPQWRPNTYTIRFNANGGSGTMPNQTVTYDTGWQFAKCAFSKAKSAFVGWATEPDGTVVYGDEADGENLSVVDGAVVDLYAVWGDAARHYGPWGYDPETTKDDVAASTLANISMSINGAEMAEGDVVAAYDSRGRLRAIGKVASGNGGLGVSFSMNATAGTELMFLLWKHGTQASDICVADTWIVVPDPGKVDNRELRLAGTPDTKIPFRSCSISLADAGWHLVSFNALPNDPSPAAAFAAVADKIGQVVRGSKVWNPGSGGRLTELEVGVGYWVQTKVGDVEWTVAGVPDPGVEIPLSRGWNLVGYPLPERGAPATVLKTAYNAGKFTQIVDGSKVYPGRLDTLEPGKGYWLYAPAACTITFDQN